MYLILNVLEIALISYIGVCVFYIFYYSLRGKLYKYNDFPRTYKYNKFVVFIPAYQENDVIFSTAMEAQKQNYPVDKYDVVVIADSIEGDVITKLRELPIKVIEVAFENSTKVKALREGVNFVSENYQVVVILDADNVMEKDFLLKMNDAYNASNMSIQGKRVAKNDNTEIAVLDGISEVINNHIFRLGYNASNLSSSIIGSGMAFDYNMFKKVIRTMDSVGGFDRELQLLILKEGIKTKYVPTAVVFDEKIQNTTALKKQRRRWVSSQFMYLKKYFRMGLRALFKGEYNFFDSAILSNLLLPRVLLLGILFFTSILYFIFADYLLILPVFWLILLIICLCALIMPIPPSYYNRKTLKSLLFLPAAFFSILMSMLTSKGANKRFIHTTHGEINSDKV